jgi:heme a synthase
MVAIRHRLTIAIWLLVCTGSVFAMVVIGGITRLTESGLSIVEWQPLIGALPPLSSQEWDRYFALYREIPQFSLVNAQMTLAEFKTIFWWEYTHRLIGRLIGLVFAVPFAFFLLRGWLTRRLTWRLLGLLVLGGLQGVIGWWMVQSGLAERVEVSQYRLAVHLLLALIILGLLFYLALSLLVLPHQCIRVKRSLALHSWLVVAMVFITIGAGALVAGTNAGLIYNTFPLMGGTLVPSEYGYLDPYWLNLFENPAAVQFNHRMLAITTFVLIAALWWRCRQARLNRLTIASITTLTTIACVQVVMGITVLLTNVPVPLAVTHQAIAVLLLMSALATAFLMRPHVDRQAMPLVSVPV